MKNVPISKSVGDTERVCQNCKWYSPDKSYSHKVLCINLDRDNCKGIEPENTCKDFILPEDYKPSGMWAAIADVVEAVDKEIKKQI